jgi:SAM-dependent methyltransferase
MLRASAEHDAQAFDAFRTTIARHSARPLKDLRILDLGCGYTAPMTVLLHATGCRVTGADWRIGYRWGLGFKPSRYLDYLKEAGLKVTARKVMGEFVYDRVYYEHLAKVTGLKLEDRNLDLRSVDVQHLDGLPDGAYDVVHSNATWEHIEDVAAANRAMARVMAPGGIAYIEIHLFPSLSGGHDMPWIVPGKTILGDVKPWQHLRDPHWQAPVGLNRLRNRDYRRLFDQTPGFTILDWQTEFTEGHDLLTPELQRELSDYSPEELTTRSIIVVAQKAA